MGFQPPSSGSPAHPAAPTRGSAVAPVAGGRGGRSTHGPAAPSLSHSRQWLVWTGEFRGPRVCFLDRCTPNDKKK